MSYLRLYRIFRRLFGFGFGVCGSATCTLHKVQHVLCIRQVKLTPTVTPTVRDVDPRCTNVVAQHTPMSLLPPHTFSTKIDDFWEPAKKQLLADAKGFMDSLIKFDKDNIPDRIIKKVFTRGVSLTPHPILKGRVLTWSRCTPPAGSRCHGDTVEVTAATGTPLDIFIAADAGRNKLSLPVKPVPPKGYFQTKRHCLQ